MQSDHPNIDLIAKIDTNDLAASAEVFHPRVVWHFVNPAVPDVAGSYHGMQGIADFIREVRSIGQGSFHIEPRGAWAVGDELVVVQSRNRLGDGDKAMSFDVVVVWRIVDGKVLEVWDIPAIYSAQTEGAWQASEEIKG
ncbi:nuclear transport factor 2 family protein [Cognatiyoonia sp. IB215182]|uniref:nuclear transport factor 2 family protein n=1 Tax=Cognatiyoonia sp. IB215182 TaxID=3097353 RepID=UPI002A0BB947|nr:nuclear transport factor 2 family protein [Cognatiyoonia sp. IB215182]MDX8355339.1 nuclear transport factor 2 family protein [Cognatiyoonia sp. IB215182]